MRSLAIALVLGFTLTGAFAQTPGAATGITAPGTASAATGATATGATSSTAAKSTTGTATNTLIATHAPAPLMRLPPIDPQPSTTSTLASGARIHAKHRRNLAALPTANLYQNGTNATVDSNAVVNGSAPTTVPGAATPQTQMQTRQAGSGTNGPPNAPGTQAMSTPAAPTNGQ